MITEYLRPKTLEEAIDLLNRTHPKTLPLSGGSVLSKSQADSLAVVDLQLLNLNRIKSSPETIEIGATATLTEIEAAVKNETLHQVFHLQAGKNQRNSGTLAGLVNIADGRSPLLTWLLAVDAQMVWEPSAQTVLLEKWLPVRGNWHEGKLITKFMLPNVETRFDFVARTPKDRPIVAIAAARWPDGRLRVVCGGYGQLPVLAWDGNGDDEKIEKAVEQAYRTADDLWATAAYRQEIAKVLTKRLIADLLAGSEKRAK